MLQINKNIAAMVTLWYKSAVSRGFLVSPFVVLQVNLGEDCIAGLPFHAFQQVLRVEGSAGFQPVLLSECLAALVQEPQSFPNRCNVSQKVSGRIKNRSK